jgi:CII-binding regulator of phage lambda lysogenization HflD
MRVVQGSSTEVVYFVAFSTADHITRVSDHTTAGFGVKFIKNASTIAGNFAITNVDGSSSPGVYGLHLIDSTVTALGAGIDNRELAITISGSMDTVTRTIELYRRSVTTGLTLALNSSGKIADVESVLLKVTSIDSRLTSMDTMLTSVNSHVTSVDSRLTSMDTMLSSVNAKVTSVDTKVSSMNTQVTSILANVTSIDSRLTSMDTMLSSVNAKVTSIDSRLTSMDTMLSSVNSHATSADTVANSILTKVTSIDSRLTSMDTMLTSVNAQVTSIDTKVMTTSPTHLDLIADAYLDRDMSVGVDSGSSVFRTPRQALRFLRNKWEISGTTLSVYAEDDTAVSWTAALSSASTDASPISAVDPA